MAGDDTAGTDPGDALEAQSGGFVIQSGADRLIYVGGMDEINVILVQLMLPGKFLKQSSSLRVQFAPVLLSGNELAVQDLDAGMQLQQIAYQGGCVAAAAAGTEVVQIVGDEAHLGLLTDDVCHGHGLVQGCIRVGIQPFVHSQHHGALTHGNMLGIHNADVLCIGLAVLMLP